MSPNRPTRRAVLAGALCAPALLAAPARARGARIEIEGAGFTYGGRPLRLTGIAMGDPVYVRARRPVEDYDVVAEQWRANCVRISVHPGHWRNARAATEALLIRDVARARANGLFVVLCWHRIGFPERYDFTPPPEWGFAPDAFIGDLDDARRFWRAMSERYGDDPAVLFELWNEPVSDPGYWEATGRDWPLFKAAWETLIADIRRVTDAIVLCTGGYWANDLVGPARDPISDPRAAYAWHAYPAAGRGEPETWRHALGGLEAVSPIVVTEWGWCRPSENGPHCPDLLVADRAGYGRTLLDGLIDAQGLSHTAWCYSVGAVPNLLETEAGAPSDYGRFVRQALRRAASGPAWARAS